MPKPALRGGSPTARTTGSHLSASTGPAQESRGGDQEFPSPHGRGVRLVHRFPPPPSASAEEKQVHQEEKAGSPGGKQDAGTQRQRKDFPRLPPAPARCQAGSSSGEGRSSLQRAEMGNAMQPLLKNTHNPVLKWQQDALHGRTRARFGVMSEQAASRERRRRSRHHPTPSSLLPHLDSGSLHLSPLQATNEKAAGLPL